MKKRAALSLIIVLACFIFTGCLNFAGNKALDSKNTETSVNNSGEFFASTPIAAEGDLNEAAANKNPKGEESAPVIKTGGEEKGSKSPEKSPLNSDLLLEAPEKENQPPAHGKDKIYCTLSISCATIWDNLEKFDENKKDLLPEDGYILAPVKVEFSRGETGFDILLSQCQSRGIHMDHNTVPLYKSKYVKGIGNIYEFDCGELSGWIFRVNDEIFNTGSSNYQLKEGDNIQWVYSCDLGKDIGFKPEGGGGEN